LMQTYLLGDEESAVCIQSRRWRFGLRRSATDNSLWLKNPSKRLFTYIQTIADRIFFEVARKGRCPGCPKKEYLAIDFGQWTVFLLHDRVFVLHIRGLLHRRKPHGHGTRVRRSRSPAKHQAVDIIWNSSVVFPFGYLPAELPSVTMSPNRYQYDRMGQSGSGTNKVLYLFARRLGHLVLIHHDADFWRHGVLDRW
jgi:hypothetical protein